MIMIAKILFWALIVLVVYAYVGYGVILFLLVKIKRVFSRKARPFYDFENLPAVTLVVAAYNEADWIAEKVRNSLDLRYPKDKIKFLFVTDGSDDETPEIVKSFSQVELYHQPERRGKIAAVHRIMPHITTPIVVFTDANTILNEDALINIVRHYKDPKVGAVAGEKRISVQDKDAANGAGEGFYWKYESKLKKWDSELYSVVGAAGELFSVRTELYEHIPTDTIIEDFFLTLSIAKKGYRVAYEPEAFAIEGPSASVKEELKRKIRIAAGGLQAIFRLFPLLNPIKYGTLSFQYVSHRVLRWTLAPLALPIILGLNIWLAYTGSAFYQSLLILQAGFYTLALFGYLLEKKRIKIKAFFIPYYFCVMNYAVYRGAFRIFNGSQSVLWERAKRG